MGSSWLDAKLIPAVSSVITTFLAAWLKFTNSDKKYRLYREAQRALERELEYFDYQLGEYEFVDNRDKILAKKAADIAWSVHKDWLPYAPNPGQIAPGTTTHHTPEQEKAK